MHQNRIIWSDLDCLLNKGQHNVRNNPNYSNDTSFIRPHINKIKQIKQILPDMLKERK